MPADLYKFSRSFGWLRASQLYASVEVTRSYSRCWSVMVLPLKVKQPNVWQRTDRKHKTTRMAQEYHYSKAHHLKHPLFLFFFCLLSR